MPTEASQHDTDLASLEREGFLILDGLMKRADLEALAGELEPWFAATPRCHGDFHGWSTTRLNGLLSKAPSVQALALHPRIIALSEAIVGRSCDCVRLNLTQAIRIHPGERAQAPHRDEEIWPLPATAETRSINVMWALSDFTEDNGATRLWPRSHVTRLGRAPDPHEARAAVMKAGSALIYLGGLTHGGGANRSSGDRTGVVVSYCAGWLRTYEEQFLAYPREVARRFSEPLQRLIGYRPHRPNLGSWEGQDPIAYLCENEGPRPHRDALPPALAAELKVMMAQSE